MSFLTVEEAATILKVTPGVVSKLVRSGRLKHIRLSGHQNIRIYESSLYEIGPAQPSKKKAAPAKAKPAPAAAKTKGRPKAKATGPKGTPVSKANGKVQEPATV